MRRKDREIHSSEQIREIVELAKILHLGLMDGSFPYIVPLHYGFVYEEDRLTFYMHCAKEGKKLELILRNPLACVELECMIELVSGGDNPCKYGSTYASIIARGEVAIVSDPEEKILGLRLLMQNQTGAEFAITEKMAASVNVLRFRAYEFSAKGRLDA